MHGREIGAWDLAAGFVAEGRLSLPLLMDLRLGYAACSVSVWDRALID